MPAIVQDTRERNAAAGMAGQGSAWAKGGAGIFAGVCDAEAARATTEATQLALAPGEVLCSPPMPRHHVYDVISGMLRLYNVLPDGRRHISRFAGGGDLLCPAPGVERYGYTAQAVSHAAVWSYRRPAFEALVRSMPALEHCLLAIAGREAEDAREHMLLLARKSAEEKLASFLLGLARLGAGLAPGTSVALPMTRRDIADHLGLKVETVSRGLNAFRRQGIVGLPDTNHALLLEVGELERRARGDGPRTSA